MLGDQARLGYFTLIGTSDWFVRGQGLLGFAAFSDDLIQCFAIQHRLAADSAWVMDAARLKGLHDSPNLLRFSFRGGGFRAFRLVFVQKRLGHTQLTTMTVYANAVGEEEECLAARMRCWRQLEAPKLYRAV